MKPAIFFLLLINSLLTDAQYKNLQPLVLADTAMDRYLQKKSQAILTIRIINAPDTIMKVPVKCTFVGFGSNLQSSKFYEFNKYGFVRIVLDARLPYQQIWLSIDHYIYAGLYVNDGLNVTIDARKIRDADGFYMTGDGVEYSGIDGELNRVMNKKVVYKQELKNTLSSKYNELSRTKRTYNEEEFLLKFDSVYQAINRIADEFITQYPTYRGVIQNQIMAEYFGNLCVAYWGDKMPDSLFRKVNSFSPFFSSNEGVLFYNYLFHYLIYKKDNPKFNIDDQLYINYSNYKPEQKTVLDSLKYYSQLPDIEKSAALKNISKKKQDLFLSEMVRINNEHFLQLIDSLYKPPKSDIFKIFLLDKGKNAFSQTYPEIIKSMKTDWCRNIAMGELKQATLKQKQIDSLLANQTKIKESNLFIGKPLGSLSFNANLYRLDNIKNLDDFIVNLKSRFVNKALVIDFWATWCVPCLKELPASKKLEESNKDLPIEFIYICTNSSSNVTVWKNKIADLQLPGTHIFADDKLVSELQRKFNSEGGFPTYVVIDINGNLKPKAIEWMHTLDRDKLKNAVGL
jgi:thiol-disulfide isomerase/thioredoxin